MCDTTSNTSWKHALSKLYYSKKILYIWILSVIGLSAFAIDNQIPNSFCHSRCIADVFEILNFSCIQFVSVYAENYRFLFRFFMLLNVPSVSIALRPTRTNRPFISLKTHKIFSFILQNNFGSSKVRYVNGCFFGKKIMIVRRRR